MPLLPITPTTPTPWRASVSNSIPEKPNAPSPSRSTTCRPGMGELGGQRVARPAAEAAVRPGVQPAAGRVRVDDAAGVGHEVAAVADDDRVAVEHLGELARRRRIGCSGARSSASWSRSAVALGRLDARAACSSHGRVVGAPPRPPAPRASRRCRRSTRPPPGAGGRAPARRRSTATISVSSPKASPKPSRKSIGTPATTATSAPFSAGAARAGEEALVVGGQAAAREPVEEDRHAAAPRPARPGRARRAPSRGSVPAITTGRSASRRSAVARSSCAPSARAPRGSDGRRGPAPPRPP